MRTAILVGIDDYAHTTSLVGCINDVKDMAAYLVGIGVQAIHSLRGPAATRAAILALLGGSIQQLRSGDELIVHYSGHGAALPGGGHLHAALCPFDFDPSGSGAIYDTEVAVMLRTLADGARVSFVVDACYAGGLQPDFARLLDVALTPRHRIRSVPAPAAFAAQLAAANGNFDTTFYDVAAQHDVVLLAACGLPYTAGEAHFSRHANGVLTHYLLRTLAEPTSAATAQAVLNDLIGTMGQFQQKPELHGRSALFTQPFLLPGAPAQGAVTTTPAQVAVTTAPVPVAVTTSSCGGSPPPIA